MNPYTIVLASGSPRRQQFLTELNLAHRIQIADIDETPLPGEFGEALARRLALAKAHHVADRLPADWLPGIVIGSDTVVVTHGGQEKDASPTEQLQSTVLGKPADAAEAVAMLQALRRAPHAVLSGVALVRVAEDGARTEQVRLNATTVTMRPYTDDEIRAYVATGDPMDKAGGYAIQHRTFDPVQRLRGCPAGVMGLPLADLAEMLAAWGVELPGELAPVCSLLTGLPCCQSGSKSG